MIFYNTVLTKVITHESWEILVMRFMWIACFLTVRHLDDGPKSD